MGKSKSERHHWWPECVSRYWLDSDGFVQRLASNGEVKGLTPKNLGVIGNGHFIKLSNEPGKTSTWDENFEPIFGEADDKFPAVIEWLNSFERWTHIGQIGDRNRFLPQGASDKEISGLVKGIVSLAVRSPMNREKAVGLAERFRGPLPQRERNSLIGINMRDTYRTAVEAIGTRGKFVVLYSPDREFIFGDGFYHNVISPFPTTTTPTIVVPLTPRISVMYTRPICYTVEPRLSTLVVSAGDADMLNLTVQIYSKDVLFFRSEQPIVTDHFRQGKHLSYIGADNPIESFKCMIPGVQKQPLFFIPDELLGRIHR